MGDCQAAAKYTLGSVPRLCESQASGFLIKQAFCLLKSSDSCDRREVAGWGPRCMCVFEDLTCRKLIGTRQQGGGSCHRGPHRHPKGKRTEAVLFFPACNLYFVCVNVGDKTTL